MHVVFCDWPCTRSVVSKELKRTDATGPIAVARLLMRSVKMRLKDADSLFSRRVRAWRAGRVLAPAALSILVAAAGSSLSPGRSVDVSGLLLADRWLDVPSGCGQLAGREERAGGWDMTSTVNGGVGAGHWFPAVSMIQACVRPLPTRMRPPAQQTVANLNRLMPLRAATDPTNGLVLGVVSVAATCPDFCPSDSSPGHLPLPKTAVANICPQLWGQGYCAPAHREH